MRERKYAIIYAELYIDETHAEDWGGKRTEVGGGNYQTQIDMRERIKERMCEISRIQMKKLDRVKHDVNKVHQNND